MTQSLVLIGGLLLGILLLGSSSERKFNRRRDDDHGPGDPAEDRRRREDMLFIWTEVHGISRNKAEAMYEDYERASTAASLGLRGK